MLNSEIDVNNRPRSAVIPPSPGKQAQQFQEILQQQGSQESGEALDNTLSQQASLQYFQYINNQCTLTH
ncbi:MAG: hypothetical protein LPH21_04750 [Shewanella sp.]|nr:hypothetical protein [Shewanella sp.]MCF1430928.1 hypothetical protein [Shewanella sp.]MCF1456881.1 hypothetical protein [Shewanella sp.]